MMMVTAMYDNDFQRGHATTPPPAQFNQSGPSTRQIEQFEMEESVMSEERKITAASTFQEPHLYDEAGFQEIELLATTEEPIYANEETEF